MMFKFWSVIQKEALILFNDKIGLLFMFLMPLLLVTIVTIVQDSAFQLATKNRIKMVVANHDNGVQGKRLVQLLESSGMFLVSEFGFKEAEMLESLKEKNALSAIYIPLNFSEELENKARSVSQLVLNDFGLSDSVEKSKFPTSKLFLYFNPILQQNFTSTITNIINTYILSIESDLMIKLLYVEMEVENPTDSIFFLIGNSQIKLEILSTIGASKLVEANSTQHNVPAWTIFAMYFMVVSLGSNIAKEKLSGSFIRIKSMPSSIVWIFLSKTVLYLLIAVVQVVVIFSFAALLFPQIGLPQLIITQNWLAFATIIAVSGMSAISYAILIGVYVTTPVQANGIGAISIVIFAALGGIWVPIFMMPDYLQQISMFSPLRQSLDSFYTLFLQDGNWADLKPSLTNLLFFITICLVATMAKLKFDRLI